MVDKWYEGHRPGGLGMTRKPSAAARHGGDRIAEALQVHGVQTVFTLCGGHISPILSAAKARGMRIVDVRDEVTAVFAADATRAPDRPARRGRGHRRAGHHQHHHRAEERAAGAVAGGADRRRRAHRAAGPRRAAGHRPAPAGDAARQALPEDAARARARARGGRGLRAGAGAACPARCSSNARWTCCTTRRRSASGTPTRPARATALSDRALRWYLNRHAAAHVRRQRQHARCRRSVRCELPRADDGALRRAAAALHKAQRPLIVIGSQAVVVADEADALAAAVGALGVPVYLSGMARGLLGRDHPLQMRHQRRNALREADCVLLAGVPCDFRLDYGKHVRRSATLIAANRSAQGRAAQPPARHRRHRRRRALHPGAGAAAPAVPGAPGRLARHAAPARPRSARPRSTPRPPRRASSSTRWPSSARWRPRPATTPSSSPTAATSSPPPATCCTRARR